MNKCPRCDAEFEGKFCTNCGAQWEEEKICPQCGATLASSVRFCNHCGHSFVANTQRQASNNSGTGSANVKQTVYSLLKFAPIAIFALFAVLLFAFYAAPVAELVVGMGFPNESLGNVYDTSSITSQMPELKGSLVTLIVLLVLSVVYACLAGVVAFLPKLKNRELNIAKWRMPLFVLMGYATTVFYLIAFATGIALLAKVSALDEGMGMLAAGSCPTLVLVFALLFALLAVGSVLVRFFLAKKSPELAQNEAKQRENYLTAEEARKNEFYATHSAPVAPVMGEDKKQFRKASVIYKHEKRKYDKADASKVSSAVVWLDMNKVNLSIIALALVIVIVLLCVLIPILTNIFRLSKVEKIKLGATKEEVARILGEPTRIDSNGNTYFWYDGKVDKKVAEIEKFEENADFSESTLVKLDQMYQELEAIEYKYIFVRFNGEEVVSEVFFDTVHHYNEKNIYSADKKEVESVNLQLDAVEAYVDNEIMFLTSDVSGTPYQAYFTDGSYYLYTASPSAEIESGNVALSWSDRIATYKVTRSYTPVYEYLTADGVLYVNKNVEKSQYAANEDIFSVIFGSQVASIGDEAFKACTNLTYVSIPDTISSLGRGVFDNCALLQLNKYDNGLYLGNEQNEYLVLVKVTDTSITSCAVAEGTKIILYLEAFANCSSLASISIAEGNANYSSADGMLYNKAVTELYCVPQMIGEITSLPSTLTTIGSFAFRNCRNLTEITIGPEITQIGDCAFAGCTKLAYIHVDSKNPSYKSDKGILYSHNGGVLICYPAGKEDTQFTTPIGVERIAKQAFFGCLYLRTLVISQDVKSIDDQAFWDCRNVVNLTILGAGKEYGTNLFGNRTYVENATVPTDAIFLVSTQNLSTLVVNEGEVIESGALWCAYGLYSVVIGDTVTTLCNAAFGSCFGLREVTIGRNVSMIDSAAFMSCTGIEGFTVDANNQYYKAVDGHLYTHDEKTFVRYAYGKEETSFRIPDSVTTIASYAFETEKSVNLKTVTIPNSVTTIEGYAFYHYDWNETGIQNIVFENPANWSLGRMVMDEEKLIADLNLNDYDGYTWWLMDDDMTLEVVGYKYDDDGNDKENVMHVNFADYLVFVPELTISASEVADSSYVASILATINDEYYSYTWKR
ncbi:MAG: leucine-rich repeat protein [Clostridiales bacterium]|nr:leucine-rich repeat protein [Clostridiales bacterium]